MRCCFGAALGLAIGLASASCGDSEQSCTPGGEGCGCVEGECVAGLTCVGGRLCLPESGDGSGDDGASDGRPGSDGGSDGGRDSGDSPGSDGSDGLDGSGDPAEPGAPVIVSLQASRIGIDDYSTALELTAQVSDPDGLDDLIGGTATAVPSGFLVGAFTQVSGGTFTLVVTYEKLEEGQLTAAAADVVLDVEFLDTSGNRTNEEVGVFVCPEYNWFCAAPNRCSDLDWDEDDCGECGMACPNGLSCIDGFCDSYGATPEHDVDAPPDDLRPMPEPSSEISLSLQSESSSPAPDPGAWNLSALPPAQ